MESKNNQQSNIFVWIIWGIIAFALIVGIVDILFNSGRGISTDQEYKPCYYGTGYGC